MLKSETAVPAEQHFILSSLSPGPAQKRSALAIVLGLLVVFVLIAFGPLAERTSAPGQCLRSGLRDGDVRVRLDHRDPPVRPVLDHAQRLHPRDRERISLRGAYPDSVRHGVSGLVCAGKPGRRLAEHVISLDVPARRFCRCPSSAYAVSKDRDERKRFGQINVRASESP